MARQYENIGELRRRKEQLKKEVSELEDILTFENTKDSLSAFTNGFTDKYLQEETQPDGEKKLALKTTEIVKSVSDSVKDSVLSKSAFSSLAKSDAGTNVVENALKIGAVTFLGNFAKNNLKKRGWKNKAIGFAVIYLAPIALRLIREKLEAYQRNKTTSSLEKLI